MVVQHNETISIGDYIVARLNQLGVKAIFGVPGDFNLALLDKIDDHPGLEWVGCCNELNAAYAADGYSRVSQGLGVLITTYGVGELSAINGVAGAFSERVPLLHIVGAPSTRTAASGRVIHHSLGDGVFDHYVESTKPFTVAQEALQEAKGAGERIDRVLISALVQRLPTYLSLPMDLVPEQIPAQPLATPLTLSNIRDITRAPPVQDQTTAVRDIVRLCRAAKKPVVFVDVGAVRYDVVDLVRDLVDKTGLPFFTSISAKAALDERHPQFRGVYIGKISDPAVKQDFESSDLVISIGLTVTDINSGGFTFKFPEQLVHISASGTTVDDVVYEGAKFSDLVPALSKALEGCSGLSQASQKASAPLHADCDSPGNALTQKRFWEMAAQFLKEGDVIVNETGTCAFGLVHENLPHNTLVLSQYTWCSIGWSVGASLGAGVAAKERGRRCVVFTGDGSVQVTAQELSSLLRLGLSPVIFLINNDGYTIERLINGPERGYNDIQPWRWGQILETFGATEAQTSVHRVTTTAELQHALDSHDSTISPKLTFVEVVLGRMDAPQMLVDFVESLTGKPVAAIKARP
ncbi:pyruvate decarboxylase [Auricularia subglabra TFB-10046 SS5]|nr:pyruvate decarboxylase [Auricularia subglabra TFB-10046 SS5]